MGVRLGSICSFQSGGTPAKGNPDYFNGNIPWITTTALNGSQIDEKDAVDWITEKAIRESAAKIVPANSIMVGTRVGIGKVAINTVDMSTSQDIISLLNIDENIWSKDFLCKFIQGQKAFLNAQARGATIKGIKIDVLSNLEVPKKDIQQQQQISYTIDKVQRIIYARKQELQQMDNLIKARFVELMEKSDLGEETTIDSITERVKVGFVGTCEKYYTDDSGIPMLRTGNITEKGIDLSDLKYVTAEFHNKNKKSQIHTGDLLIARHGSNGQANVYYGPEAQCLNAVVIVPNQKIASSVFLAGLINSPAVKRQIEHTLVGSTQHVVNTKSIARLTVRLPDVAIQKEYESFVAQVDKSKAIVKKALEETQTLFDCLMQEHFR